MIAPILLLQAASVPPPALPELHGGPAPMTCPVGGEAFSGFRPGSFSTYGARPDGRPYSYLSFPFPLPECPTNKLVVFDDYTPAEVARLTALIATPEYRAMTATDTPYYRASWLATRLGRPPVEALWLLLNATWEVKGGDEAAPTRPELARRYNEEFARGVAALPAATKPQDRVPMLARGANALRELGRFDESRSMLDQARVVAAEEGVEDGWLDFIDKLAPVIARRDKSLEPLDLIPPRVAAARCRDEEQELTAQDRALCRLPSITGAR